MALTVRRIEKLIEPGRHLDERGLYLQVRSESSKSWLLRYERDGRERWMGLPDENLFIFRRAERELEGFPHLRKAKNKDAAHAVVMVQARIENPLGGKSYVPITLWDDGKWRVTEPDVLPIFGVEQLVDTGKRVAFLHEGAKAARAARKISEAHDRPERDRCEEDKLLAAHPWAFDLAGGVHLGWIGGARRVDGTDWSALRTALNLLA